jgi:hypothetical protein
VVTHDSTSRASGGHAERPASSAGGAEAVGAVLGALEGVVVEEWGAAAWDDVERAVDVGAPPSASTSGEGVGERLVAAVDAVAASPAALGRALGAALAERVAADADGPARVERVARRLGTALAPTPSPFEPPPVETARLGNGAVLVKGAAGRIPCPLLAGVLSGAAAGTPSPPTVTEVTCRAGGAEQCEHLVGRADGV